MQTSDPMPIIIIHGGMAYESPADYEANFNLLDIDLERLRPKTDWKQTLEADLGKNYAVYLPKMPSSENAHYDAWRKMFEKVRAKIQSTPILIGHSLGGIFLARYLSEKEPTTEVRALFLIAAPFWEKNKTAKDKFYFERQALERIQIPHLFIYHSEDDEVVPYSDAHEYATLLPQSTLKQFTDRGHFNVPQIPELIKDIQAL